MRDYKLYLKDILGALEAIEKFVENREYGTRWTLLTMTKPQVQ